MSHSYVYICVYNYISNVFCTCMYIQILFMCIQMLKEKLQDYLTCYEIFHLGKIEAPLFTNTLQNILEYVSD